MMKHRSKGIAIPVVLLFTVCTLVFAIAIIFFRTEVKHQHLVNIHFIQANLMAQSAIQHLLLKAKYLPHEFFEAGVLQRGYCPFQAIRSDQMPDAGKSSDAGMELFRGDCNTDEMRIVFPEIEPDDWLYEIASLTVISAFTDIDNDEMVQMVRIVANGRVNDPRGGRNWRTEEMVKTVEFRRSR